ncbi:hypothetical protein TeGR_g15037, partial [Tetraparma gracilis]
LLPLLLLLSLLPPCLSAAFGGTPTAVPASLIAGAASNLALTLELATELPADGKVKLTVPAGFAAAGVTGAAVTAGMDGGVAAAVDGTGPWVVTISRDGSGSAAAAGSTLALSISALTNMRSAGSSGTFPLLTTTDAGDNVLDEASASVGSEVAAVTFTASDFGADPTVTPASLVAGAVGTATVAFTNTNPIPADGKIVLEVPDTFAGVADSSTVTAVGGIDGNFAMAVTGSSPFVVTITRSGGSVVAAATSVSFTVAGITNQKFAGASGAFGSNFKTTTAAGADIDVATTLPPSVTFTASDFGADPTITPASLVAGTVGTATVAFTNTNPIPADGKIVLEVPDTFAGVADSSTVTAVGGIDGNFAMAVTGTSPFVVTITRSGGSEVAAATSVSFTVAGVTNQKFAGASGAFGSNFKTTTAAGADIDVATTLPPSVTFTASDFGADPTITPASLVAGTVGTATVAFTNTNPIPADGKIILEVPDTFAGVADSSTVTAVGGIDGNFAMAVTGTSPFVVTITRSGGSVVAAATSVSFTVAGVTDQKFAGASGAFGSNFKTTTAAGADIDVATTLPPSVTFTASDFGADPTVTPASLVAGTVGTATVAFTNTNPIPADGKIILEVPDTFAGVADSSTVTAVGGIDGNFAMAVTGTSPFVVTITRSGGSVVAAATSVSFTVAGITNQKFAGASGAFGSNFKTTTAAGADIDVATTLPPSVTFTASDFGADPTVTPASLVAGTVGTATVAFTNTNPIPADGKIILEVPDTFAGVADSSTVTAVGGIDGNFAMAVTGTS